MDPKIPYVWQRVAAVCKDFFVNKSQEFKVWENAENLEGLVSGLNPENLEIIIETLSEYGFDFDFKSNTEVVLVITALAAGIRIGNALDWNEVKLDDPGLVI